MKAENVFDDKIIVTGNTVIDALHWVVNKIANDFNWRLGEKKVIIHTQKLGLRNHFIWVGDQTERFKNVIFLEDDLIVSPELLRTVPSELVATIK